MCSSDLKVSDSTSMPHQHLWRALDAAAEHGRLDMVYLFLKNDSDVETLDIRCKRAAKLASTSLVLAKLLRQHKKNVHIRGM